MGRLLNFLTQSSKQLSKIYKKKLQDLSYNELETIPVGIGFLVRLIELDLSHNKLKELPADTVNLRSE